MILNIDDSLLMGKNICKKGFREQLVLFFYEKEFITVGHAASFCGLNMAEFKSLIQKKMTSICIITTKTLCKIYQF